MKHDCIVKFRLYVAGDLPNSRRAIANLRAYCEQNLSECHQLEILDVFDVPEQVLEDNIMLTPQLVVIAGERVHYIVGDLSETEEIRKAALDGVALS